MTITPSLFEAFLKCPSKCWLRATGETPSGNPYAEWVQSQNESYRTTQTKRLLAEIPPDATATSPPPERLKTSQWLLALDAVARTPDLPRSSRREEAPSSSPQPSVPTPQPGNQSPATPAATAQPTAPQPTVVAESHLHAIERLPSAGRGNAAQFIPIRFLFFNKLGKDDKLLLAFDAFVLAQALGREIPIGKLIHGDASNRARSSRGNEAQTSSPSSETPAESQSLLTSAATSMTRSAEETAEALAGISPTPSYVQPRVTKVKTSALAAEVRKRLGKLAALLASPTPPDLVLNRHCAECEFRDRCRKIAVEKDDLSLLAGMSAKERHKLRTKGIFTVTQLSYTFRPRRRPKRLRDKREKHHHALKALAIREKKIHIVGSPAFLRLPYGDARIRLCSADV